MGAVGSGRCDTELRVDSGCLGVRYWFPLQDGRIAPQTFQAVERALVAMENVNDHL